MTQALAVQVELVASDAPSLIQDQEAQYVTETPTGLIFAEDTPIEVWGPLTERLIRQHKRIEWAIGDAIVFGGRRYHGMYEQWVNETGLSENTLSTMRWVAERVESLRRRKDVGWSHHREVAALPPEDQDSLLDMAADLGLTRHDLRERVKEIKQQKAAEAALAAPAPEPLFIPGNVRIEVGDARSLPLDDESVHLTITSPPYGVGRPYAGGGDVAAGDWPGFMHDWLLEVFRVTAPNGRLALNVPLDTSRGGFRPTYAQAVQMADAAGWQYRSTIVWFDDQLGKSTARGSLDSAGAPHVYAGAEMIALFSKGDWRRERPDPMPLGDSISHEDWLSWTNGVWRWVGETQAWEGHPAPFPYEIPRRLAMLLSFPGDTILDPFCGSGTVGLLGRLGREVVCFDKSPLYVRSSQRRVVQGSAVA